MNAEYIKRTPQYKVKMHHNDYRLKDALVPPASALTQLKSNGQNNGQLSSSTRKAVKQSKQKTMEAPAHNPKGTKHSITNYNKDDSCITQ